MTFYNLLACTCIVDKQANGVLSMTNIDLRKLNRKQLLELLLQQTQRADELEKQLQEANDKLEKKVTIEKESGSIAIAALQLNGVFDAAQHAADQYLEIIKKKSENIELENARLEEECRKKCQLMLEQTNNLCMQKEAELNDRVEFLTARINKLLKFQKQLEDLIKKEMNHE